MLDLKDLPKNPGCYLFLNKNKKVIYVGKAKNLANRVKQYFDSSGIGIRKEQMVEQIDDINYIITDSEVEALILETNLIKKYKPKYNILMKDDKNYQWLMFDLNEDYPRPTLVREKKNVGARYKYFGPFVTSVPIKNTLNYLRKIFPYRTCNRRIYIKDKKIHSSSTKPCLYYHLGLCEGPCIGNIPKKEYRKNINSIIKFFNSEKDSLLKSLRDEMYKASKSNDFEDAIKFRDRMNSLLAIRDKIDVLPETDEISFLNKKKEKNKKALIELIEKVGYKELSYKEDFKIECYDISNISGTLAVGSMVVFANGVMQKKLYRRFRIQSKTTPNDFAMLKEVLNRRFSFNDNDESFSIYPDLIIVDGGKGQVSSVLSTLKELNVNIPVIGLAERFEEIIVPKIDNNGINFRMIRLSPNNEARLLMQRIRDEAHRFAITYHKKLRLKKQNKTILDNIPGVGPSSIKKILKYYPSIDALKKAKEKDLLKIINNRKIVKSIIGYLSPVV